MAQCSKCGAELKDGARFCTKCGAPVEENPSVEDVIEEVKADVSEVEENIAEAVEAPAETPVEENAEAESVPDDSAESDADVCPEAEAETETSGSKKFAFKLPKFNFKMPEIKLPKLDIKLPEIKDFKKYGVFAGAALLVVLAVVLICSLGGKSESSMLEAAFYVKDGEIQYSELNKKDAYEVSSKLCSDWESEEFNDAAYDIGNACVVTDDGKTIFYPTKIEESDDSYTLNMRKLGSKKDPVKISSGVTDYAVADGGAVVFYDKEGNLYRYVVKNDESEKVFSEFSNFIVSEDGKSALIKDADGKLYSWTLKDGSEKIDTDIDSYYSSEDMSSVIYRKEDTVYSWNLKDGREKLVKDVSNIAGIDAESGTFYYTVDDENVVKYADLIKGDDDELSFFGDYGFRLYSLYYYDGKDSQLISENFLYSGKTIGDTDYSPFGFSGDTGIICTIDPDSVEKISYEKYRSGDDASSLLFDTLLSGASYCSVINGKVAEIDIEEGYEFTFAPDGSCVYFINDINEKKTEASLYKIKLSGSKASKPELFDEEVSCESLYSIINYIYFADDDSIAYYKDVKDGEGEFYIDGKLVADDVSRRFYYILDDGSMVLLTDYNSNKGEGTLCSWNGKKLEEITDESASWLYVTLPNGSVLYFSDFSERKCEGELYYWKNGKSAQLDDDVSAILRVYTVSSFYD